MGKKLNIGGQAIIEGLMIRGPKYNVIGIRKKKKIILKKEKIKQRKGKFYKLPIVRGFYNLVDMLVLGMKSLMWSADQQAEAEEEKITKKEMTFSVVFAILFGIGLFVLLPYVATNFIGYYEETQPMLFNLIDGIIRIAIFITYILVISLLKDVKVLFQYHGAEHKAIHCYEHGKELTLKNVKKYTTLHPRCGTAFIMIVLVISILVFSVLPPIIMFFFPNFINMHVFPRKIILFFLRLSLLPLIAGIAYEFLKLSAKYEKNSLMKIAIWPGLFLQKITTKEPTFKQSEVAIAVTKKVLQMEKKAPFKM